MIADRGAERRADPCCQIARHPASALKNQTEKHPVDAR
jgi:hypothetical protein